VAALRSAISRVGESDSGNSTSISVSGPLRPVTVTEPSFSNSRSMLWLVVSRLAVKQRIPFWAARRRRRSSSAPPSPRPCIASITETAASATCGRRASRT
jgi:hypothetical protein